MAIPSRLWRERIARWSWCEAIASSNTMGVTSSSLLNACPTAIYGHSARYVRRSPTVAKSIPCGLCSRVHIKTPFASFLRFARLGSFVPRDGCGCAVSADSAGGAGAAAEFKAITQQRKQTGRELGATRYRPSPYSAAPPSRGRDRRGERRVEAEANSLVADRRQSDAP